MSIMAPCYSLTRIQLNGRRVVVLGELKFPPEDSRLEGQLRAVYREDVKNKNWSLRKVFGLFFLIRITQEHQIVK